MTYMLIVLLRLFLNVLLLSVRGVISVCRCNLRRFIAIIFIEFEPIVLCLIIAGRFVANAGNRVP